MHNLLDSIVAQFSVCMLTTIAMHVSYTTRNIYSFWLYIKDLFVNRDFAYVLSVCHWILLPMCSMLSASATCAAAADEGNRTADVLHTLKFIDKLDRSDPTVIVISHSF